MVPQLRIEDKLSGKMKKQSRICLSKFNIMHVFNSSISVSSLYFFFPIFSFLFQTRLTILISPNSFNRLHFFVRMQVFRFIICLYSGYLESYQETQWCRSDHRDAVLSDIITVIYQTTRRNWYFEEPCLKFYWTNKNWILNFSKKCCHQTQKTSEPG